MKKKMMTLALAAIFTMGGLSAMAQNAQQDRAGDKKECCKKDGKKCDKKDGKKCDKKKEGKCDKKGCKKSQQNLFQGLNLTEQQQAAIAQIPNPREVMKAARENAKDGQGEKMSKEMRESFVKNVRMDYLKSIKGVLSSDQYVQFLENFYTDSSAMKGDKKDGKKFKEGKKMGDRRGEGRQGKDRAERRADKK